jgi:glutamate 5-kinase
LLEHSWLHESPHEQPQRRLLPLQEVAGVHAVGQLPLTKSWQQLLHLVGEQLQQLLPRCVVCWRLSFVAI